MKAQTILWYAEFKSIVQREFRQVFKHDVTTARSMKMWHDTFLANGLVGEKRYLEFNTAGFVSQR